MGATARKRQNFDVTPEQEAEILWLRDALGLSTAKDAVLRAVRIAGVLARETRDGGAVLVRNLDGSIERLVLPELERPDAGWRWIVVRPHPWRRQASLKGRRLLASTVWSSMLAEGQTAAEAADDWDLPVEAVEEAVRWCEAHRELVALEAAEERRRLADAEVGLAPPPR